MGAGDEQGVRRSAAHLARDREGLNISNTIDLIGSFGFLALILFVVGSLLIGMLMGGRDPAVRSVLGLGTAQRNVAAAILVTSLNFSATP